MSKSKSPPLRRVRLDGRAWLALLAFALLWFMVLRGWPLIGREAAQLLGRWVHPAANVGLNPRAGGLFGGMALEDIGSRFGLYVLETAAVGLVGWLGLAAIARERPFRLLTDAPRFRLGLMLFGLVVCAGTVLAQRYVQAGGSKLDLGWGVGSLLAQALWAACLLALTLTVGFFEEAIFRGGLLRLAPRSAWLVPFALVVNAGLFAAVHGAQSPVEFVDRFALGMALGYATLRLRGIELAVGLHAGFDFAAMLLHPGQLEAAPWTIATAAAPHLAAPGLPWQVELTAGAAMAAIFSLIAIVLTELVIRLGGVLGLGRRERSSVTAPAAWGLDESQPVQV